MDSKFLLLLISALVNFIQASSSESDSSSISSLLDDQIQPPCLKCPKPKRSNKSCKKGKRLILTDQTCYTCPKYKCVKKKYLKNNKGKFCLKIMPVCSKAHCSRGETCLVTVQTIYSCSKAKCVKRLLGRDRLEDHYNI